MTSQGFEEVLANIPSDESNEVYTDDFMELSHLGYLSTEVNWCGHVFTIRTLKVAEEIAAAKLVKLGEETLAQFKITHAAVVAAAIVTVNGQLFMPAIGPNTFDNIHVRYNYIIENWYWPTIEFLAEQHNILLKRQWDALEELQKKLAPGQSGLFDLSGHSTGKDSSTEI